MNKRTEGMDKKLVLGLIITTIFISTALRSGLEKTGNVAIKFTGKMKIKRKRKKS